MHWDNFIRMSSFYNEIETKKMIVESFTVATLDVLHPCAARK